MNSTPETTEGKMSAKSEAIKAQRDAKPWADSHETALDRIEKLERAFDVPGLTGLWRYHREGFPPLWCASYVKGGGVYDTKEYMTPWEALDAARSLSGVENECSYRGHAVGKHWPCDDCEALSLGLTREQADPR